MNTSRNKCNRQGVRQFAFELLEPRQLLAITVDTLIDEADGSITDGDISLRDAIALAPDDETILFHPSLDNALLGLNQGELIINKPLTIDATGLPNGFAITAQGNSRVFLIDDGESSDVSVQLRGLRITGGTAAEGGAGIHSAEPLTLSNSTVINNDGHGVYAEFNDLTIESSIISGNEGVGVFSYGAPYINFANTVAGSSLVVRDANISQNGGEGVFARLTLEIEVTGSKILENGGRGVHTNTLVAPAVDITPPSHSLSVVNSEVSANVERGVLSLGGTVEFLSSIVSGNQGGGIENRGLAANLVVRSSLISGNSAEIAGGGIEAVDLVLTDSTVRDNSSPIGAGIYLRAAQTNDRYGSTFGNAIISGSSILDNDASESGGGLSAGPVNIDILNSTISGNTAVMFGGGLYLRTSSPVSQYPGFLPSQTIASSTITKNSAGQGGGGLAVVPPFVESASATVINTIVAGNFGNTSDTPDISSTGAFSLIGSLIGIATNSRITSDGASQLGTLGSPIDAMLGPLSDNGGKTLSHALLELSPAIDRGVTSEVDGVAYDQRGVPFRRVFGDQVDIGAIEAQPTVDAESADFDFDGDVDGVDFLTWQRGAGMIVGASAADGDADQDGDVDAEDLIAWQSQYQLSAALIFTEAPTSLGSGLLNQDVDLAHLNGDEFLDALVTTENGPIQVWLGNGDGSFSMTNQAFGFGNNIYAALGDIDDDGDTDVVVAVANSEVALWLNDGGGRFSSGGSLSASSPLDLALAHLNDDNLLDLYVAQASHPDLVFLNDPTFGLVDSGQLLGNSSSKGVELADLNGDGFVDAFVAHSNGPNGAANTVWFNDGNGTLIDSGQRLGNAVSQHVSLGDLDGDFDIDAVVANDGINTVYLNDGNGVFSESGQSLGIAGSSHVQLADFDLDGDLDVYVANWFDQPDQIWLNNGTGIFLGSQQLGSETGSHVALGDIDNDGDIDAVVANFSNSQVNRIWLNGTSTELNSLDSALAEFEEEGLPLRFE